jgi:Ice-binding-like
MPSAIANNVTATRHHRPHIRWGSSLLALFVLGAMLTLLVGGAGAATPISLGTADTFAVLAATGITNTGATVVSGDIGSYPTAAITGTSSLVQTGTNHTNDAVSQQAQVDLTTAYLTAQGDGGTTAIPNGIFADGTTLTPGVYNSGSSIEVAGALTLDGGGDPNAVFVFQAGSTLLTDPASLINLINGANACNVYWQVGSSATLNTTSNFSGSILALTSITLDTGAVVDGRVLAQNGAVTLDDNTITTPVGCAATTAATDTTATADTPTTPDSSAPADTSAPAAAPTPVVTPTPLAAPTPVAAAVTIANLSVTRDTAANAAARAKAAATAKLAATKAAAAKATAARAVESAKTAATAAAASKAAASKAAASTSAKAATAKLVAAKAATAKLAAAKAATAKLAAAKAASAARAARAAALQLKEAMGSATRAAHAAKATATRLATAKRNARSAQRSGFASKARTHVGLTG